LRCNPQTSCSIDPYARDIEGHPKWTRRRTLSIPVSRRTVLNAADSGPFMPRSVVTNPYFDWSDIGLRAILARDGGPSEVHVEGPSRKRHPDVRKKQRGKYAGLASPAAIQHLRSLESRAVELLPMST